MTLAFFVGAIICGLRATGLGESNLGFGFVTTGGSLSLTSSAGCSVTTETDFSSRRGAEVFLIVGRTRLAVLVATGASLTTGFGAGGCGSGSATFASTFGGGDGGAGCKVGTSGRSCASELLNTSAPRPQQAITMSVAITPSVRNLLFDTLRCS